MRNKLRSFKNSRNVTLTLRLTLKTHNLKFRSRFECSTPQIATPKPFTRTMAHLTESNALFGELKSSQPFFVIAGPNVIQSEEHIFAMCRELKRVTDALDVPFIFKSSFDKANRTSITSFRGPGIDEGLRILQSVKTRFDVPIVTDIHTEAQAEPVSAVADVMQIPAFLCRQTDLLLAAGRTGRVINIKKGQFCAPSVMRNSAKKVFSTGNENVLLCERGSTFGYSDLVVDVRNIPLMRDAGCPIVADVTHSLQQPAGLAGVDGAVASGGSRELIPTIARSCVAAGVDGLFMEVHNDPTSSPVDGPTQWPLRHFHELLAELKAIALATKARTQNDAKLDLTPMCIL